MNPTGAAHVDFDIVDTSPVVLSLLKGVAMVQGITEREPLGGKPKLISSVKDYNRYYGGFLPDSQFPELCFRVFKKKGSLIIWPAKHYSDITNPATIQGSAATVITGQAGVAETKATGTITINVKNTGEIYTANANGSSIGAYTALSGDTPTLIATGLAAAINAATSTNGGYTATSTGAVVTVIAPVGSGTGANAIVLTCTISGAVALPADITVGSFAGGITAVTAVTAQGQIIINNSNKSETFLAKVGSTTIGSTTTSSSIVTPPSSVAYYLSLAINTATGTNGGYTASATGNVVNVTAPTGSGSAANAYVLTCPVSGVGSNPADTTCLPFSGGVTGVSNTNAHGSYTINTKNTGETYIALANGVALGQYVALSGDTTTLIATGLTAAINAATATNGGFTATSSVAVVTITAPANTGAAGNANVMGGTVYGNGSAASDATSVAFAGGITAVTQNQVTWTASSVGAWANGNLNVSLVPASSGLANCFDVTVSLTGYPANTIVYYNFPASPQAADITNINALFELVQYTSQVGNVMTGNAFATGGGKNNAAITTSDYIGDSDAQTGIYAFDDVTFGQARRISCPEMCDPVLDAALQNYVDTVRMELRAVLRTPFNVTAAVAIAYRFGTSPYNHAPINSWRCSMIYGGIQVTNPVTYLPSTYEGCADALGCMSVRDNDQNTPYAAFAGSDFGTVPDYLQVIDDVGLASKVSDLNSLDGAGIIPLIKRGALGAVFWGNSTLWLTNQLIGQQAIGDMVLSMYIDIQPLVDAKLWKANDPKNWRKLYTKVSKAMKPYGDKEGIYPGGEGIGWKYFGDQNCTDATDQTKMAVNNVNDVQNGIYKAKLYIKPIGTMKWIGFEIGVTAAGVSFSQILQDN